ncbi:hypothetical protein GCM10009624_27870 [Gordonia sinesedis]
MSKLDSDFDAVNISAFVRVSMPDDFTDLLGALFACGFNYSMENRLVDGVLQLTLQGYHVNEDGEPHGDRSVLSTWEYRDGEWTSAPEATGLHRILKSGEVKLEPRTHLGQRHPPGESNRDSSGIQRGPGAGQTFRHPQVRASAVP